jgi:uncharacterized protein YbaR (Trm112 family)
MARQCCGQQARELGRCADQHVTDQALADVARDAAGRRAWRGSQMNIDPELLDMLQCPATRRPLRLADAELLEKLNAAIAAGNLRNLAGERLTSRLDGGLLRDDGALLYPIVDGIPSLLADEGVPLTQLE